MRAALAATRMVMPATTSTKVMRNASCRAVTVSISFA
jgi:hypothetical protein